MKLNKKSFKLTVSIVCAFVLLAVCARVTERALPASAQTGEKPVIVLDAGHDGYALSGVAI